MLIPAGSGPLANQSLNGAWQMDWKLREADGQVLTPPGSRFSNSQVELTESVNGGPFKAAGSQQGAFTDLISPESRTITQQFSVDGKRVQVVLGRDHNGKLVTTWDVKVTIKYPNAPAYSAAP